MRTYSRTVSWLLTVLVIATFQILDHTAVSQVASLPSVEGEGPAQMPRFAIISVRETQRMTFQEGMSADGYAGNGVNLNHLIMEAYGIPQLDRLVGTPKWSSERRFDIQAKVDDPDIPILSKLSPQQQRTMLKQILTERFQLTMHEEERVQPIYVLTAMKKPGPFLERSRLNDADSESLTRPVRIIHRLKKGQLTEERFTMPDFANQLAGILHRVVVDKTNLDGLYDIQIDWNPDDALPTMSDASDINRSDSPKTNPSIFTALQEQLGLKLSAAKGPARVWVIDHVELPSEN